MKLGFVYIATHKTYFRHLKGFIETIERFCPEIQEKYIVVFTDQQCKIINDVILESKTGIKLIYKNIEHKPWPLNALLKFQYVKSALKILTDGYFVGEDLVFYSDSKVEFTREIHLDEVWKPGKITTVLHNMHPNYPTDYQLLQFWVQNKNTNAHIDGHYMYHQSGFFGGAVRMLKPAMEQCIKWTNNDLANHRIPCVDDESYWNRWIYENPNEVFTLPEGFWGCATDPESPWHDAAINLRDHGDAEWYKYQVKEGLI